MHYGTIKTMDTANGPWLRVSLFVSGCHHACPGCFNPEAWNFKFGEIFTQAVIDEILLALKADHIAGLTLLGGEPLAPENQSEVRNLIAQVKEKFPEKTIRCYSGFTYEFITEYMFPKLPFTYKILSHLDVLIDGRFEQDLLDLNLKFRGSKNQRVLNVPLSLEKGKALWSKEVDDEQKYYPVDVQAVTNRFAPLLENFSQKYS